MKKKEVKEEGTNVSIYEFNWKKYVEKKRKENGARKGNNKRNKRKIQKSDRENDSNNNRRRKAKGRKRTINEGRDSGNSVYS